MEQNHATNTYQKPPVDLNRRNAMRTAKSVTIFLAVLIAAVIAVKYTVQIIHEEVKKCPLL